MKQIIMDLADKAIEDMPKIRWEIPDEFCEKFAELIVKECVSIVAKRKDQAIDDDWNVDEAMTMAEMDLEEHFRVGEQSTCIHDWYSAKNPVVQNGSVCVICGAIDAREPEELKNERY